MPFNRPTLTELNERVENQAKGLFGITVLLRRSFLSVISKVVAGVAHVWHGHLDYIARQIIPTQMDGENLDRFGSLYNLKRLSARKGQFNMRFTNTLTSEIAILASSVFVDERTGNKRFVFLDQGINYRIEANSHIFAEVVSIGIGKDLGSLTLNELLAPETSVAGLAAIQINSITTQAVDDESTEDFRVRVLDRLRRPSLCGVAADYVTWVKEFSVDYTRVYVFPRYPRLGSVTVFPLTDTSNQIIPPDQAAVDVLETFLKISVPATANPVVGIVNLTGFRMTMKLRPNTTTIRTRIGQNILDFIQRNSHVRGATNPDTNEIYTGELFKSKLDETISLTQGVEDHFIETIGFVADENRFFNASTGVNEPIIPLSDRSAFLLSVITYEDFQ